VAVFVRVPLPGQVKTRLAPGLGIVGACELYRAMVTDILANLKDCGFPVYLFHDGTDSRDLPGEWLQAASSVVAQTGDSLGEKMASAFEQCFAENVDKVVLVGSDIPGLDSGIMITAAAALAERDVAIAPAADGGYCLIALKPESYQSGIFAAVPWSTGQVLRVTLERCEHYKLEVELLATLQDIDTIEDIAAYCRKPALQAVATNCLLAAAGYL